MDLFAGLDGLGPKNKEPQSLAEKQKAAEAKKAKQGSNWADLDLLGGFQSAPVSGGATPGNSTPRTATPTPASSDPFENLPILPKQPVQRASSTPAQPAAQPKPQSKPSQEPRLPQRRQAAPAKSGYRDDFDDSGSIGGGFDDDFGDFQSSSRASRASTHSSAKSVESRASREATQRSQQRSNDTSSRPRSSRNSDRTDDRAVAQMVDMGFEAEDAQRALQAMEGSVSGAVSWLMAEAQGRPLPTPRKQHAIPEDWDQLGQAASEIGKSVFATASTWWSKGRKEISKAYNDYSNPRTTGAPRLDSGTPSSRFSDDEPYEPSPKSYNDEHFSQPISSSNRFREGTETTSQRSSTSRFKSDDAMPSRPRPRPSTPNGEPTSNGQTQGNGQPAFDGQAKKSRADLFRERQAQRRGSPAGQTQSSTPPASSQPTSEPSTPEVDLLNLTGPTKAAAVGGAVGDMLTTSRKAGTDAFSRGDYATSVEAFTQALSAAPQGHPLRAVLYSNRAAAYLKTGNSRAAFDDANAGLELIDPKTRGKDQELEAGKTLGDVWVKLMTRRAQAAEHLERFRDALDSWKQLLDAGHVSPTALESKRRCQAALNPDIEKKAAAQQAAQAQRSKRRGWGTTGEGPTSAEGKAALEKIKREHETEAAESAQREALYTTITARVDTWKAGKDNDIRHLLANLHTVLWPGSGWQPVTTADLVVPKKVRIAYMKAVARTHPDKVPASAPLEQRMVAESVFITIQHAWEGFRTENGLS